MTFLVCCRLRRRPRTPTYTPDTLNEISHDDPAYERGIPTFVIDELPPSSFDDTGALQTLFSSSSSVRGYRTANMSQQNSSQDTVQQKTRVRTSGSRLEVVSGKIRRRFSRESRMNKKSSWSLSRMSKNRNPDGKDSSTAVQLPDILAGGYDSDAENIQTPPQTLISGTIKVSPEYLTRVLRQVETAEGKRTRRHIELVRKDVPPREHRDIASSCKLDTTPTSEFEKTKGNDLPTTPRNKRADSVPTVWEFGSDESPRDMMRRISIAVSERSRKFPSGPAFTAPRRKSSRQGQETTSNRVPTTTTLDTRPKEDPWKEERETPKPENQSVAPIPELEDGDVEEVEAGNDEITTGKLRSQLNSTATVQYVPDQSTSSHPEDKEVSELEVGTEQVTTIKSHTEHSAATEPIRDAETKSTKSVHLFDMKISQRLASGLGESGAYLPLSTPSRRASDQTHTRGKSSLNSLNNNPYQVKRKSKASSTGVMSTKMNPEWPALHEDDASSVYASQPGSLPSSGRASMLHIPSLVEELAKETKDRRRISMERRGFDHTLLTIPDEGEWMRRHTIDTCHSSTDSFRAKELANAAVRFPSQSRRASEPQKSKFTEGFESPIYKLDSPARSKTDLTVLKHRYDLGSGVMSRSVSDGWLSQGRRHGFGFEPVSEDHIHVPPSAPEDDAAVLWERALKFHAEETAEINSNHPGFHSRVKGLQRGESLSKYVRRRRSTCLVSPSVSSERHPPVDIVVRPNTPDEDFWSSPAEHTVRSRKESQIMNFSNRSYPSWTQFPSHSRKDRTEHAGLDDHVIARDFSPPEAAIPRKGSTEMGLIEKHRRKKKTMSMTFGKRNLFSKTYWMRLYRSHSSDMRRFQTGHRSSVSVGGNLEYPELEIIPGGELAFVMSEVRGLKSQGSVWRSRSSTSHGEAHVAKTNRVAGESSSWNWGDEGGEGRGGSQRGRSDGRPMRPSLLRPSASIWSRLYEECVEVAKRRVGMDGGVDEDKVADEAQAELENVLGQEVGRDGDGDGVGHEQEQEQERGPSLEEPETDGEDDFHSAVDGHVGDNGQREACMTPIPERGITEMSEMSDFVRGLIEGEERARVEVLGRAEGLAA
jgi:hypothetical protein